jgi:hypothetical protein
MSSSSSSSWSRRAVAGALAAALLAGAAARADVKPKEPEKGPDAQGSGSEGDGKPPPMKNPLPEIIEMMKQVERRLAETDTGEWTREEQERIVKALELEGQTVERLKKLIEEIEANQQSGGGGGGGGDAKGKPKPRSGGQNSGRTPQTERQQDAGQQPVNPNAGQNDGRQEQSPNRPENQQQGEKNDQEGRNDQARETQLPPGGAAALERARAAAAGETWGSLPPKQAREVMEAKRREPPQQWRKQIEDYFRKLAETKK